MPYIDRKTRGWLDDNIQELVDNLENQRYGKGDLNYVITQLVIGYVEFHGKRYSTLSDVTGVLSDVKTEWERRVVAPYEARKMAENGDVGYEKL